VSVKNALTSDRTVPRESINPAAEALSSQRS
jgi:hypothetical protein